MESCEHSPCTAWEGIHIALISKGGGEAQRYMNLLPPVAEVWTHTV